MRSGAVEPTPRRANPAMPPASSAPPQAGMDRRAVRSSAPADSLHITLGNLVRQLPEEVLGHKGPLPADMKVCLQREPVLAQLPRGAVRVPFGVIRQGSPPGIFLNSSRHDQHLVELPLQEIVPQLPPEHFALHCAQRQVEVPQDLADLFEPGAKLQQRQAGFQSAVRRAQIRPSPASPPAASATPAQAPAIVPNPAGLHAGRIEEALREPAARSADFHAGSSDRHIRPAPGLPPAGAAAEAPDTAHLTRSAPEETLTIGLTAVWEKWPESLRAKIAAHLPNARLQLPLDTLERRLRQGSLLFTWKELCQWIEASPPEALAFMAVDNRLELPLPVVAPLFFQYRPFARKNDAPFSSDVPEVFSSRAPAPPEPELADEQSRARQQAPSAFLEPRRAQPREAPLEPPARSADFQAGFSGSHTSPAGLEAGAPVPAPKPLAQPAGAPPEVPDPAVLEPPAPAPAAARAPHNLAELFGEPAKRSWTPNEIVKRTCELPGVAGAVMALHDGLLVASCLPPDWRADLLTAFLPQIFGRMGQYCQELQLGPLREVALTVEQGTLQVFQAGLVFFAVLGEPSALPWRHLRLIAGELSRHTK